MGRWKNLIALFTVQTAIQTHIWKIVGTVKPVQVFHGLLVGTEIPDHLFTLFRSKNVTASVPLPYVFLCE